MVERVVLRDLFGERQDLSELEWQPFRPGVEISRIYGEGSVGPAAAFLRYAPGARIPEHDHSGYEHIVVLRGAQSDQQGRYEAGTCLIHAEGSSHAVVSDEGCIVLAIWNAPVAFR
jgi:anti-sigma factor ChrR (cupin superfamily)